MSETIHVVIVGSIMALFPLALLAQLVYFVIRDRRLDLQEKREAENMRLRYK